MSPCTCGPGTHHPSCLLRTLQPGQRVTATVSPLHRGTYQITGVLRGGVDSELLLGGWELVRLANGGPPVYLRSVELAGDEPAEDAAPGPRVWQVDEPALLSETSPSDGEPVPLDPTFEEQLLALATGKDLNA